MESYSQSGSSSDTLPQQRLATIVGTAIALLTLTLPLVVIASYSPSSVKNEVQAPYPVSELRK